MTIRNWVHIGRIQSPHGTHGAMHFHVWIPAELCEWVHRSFYDQLQLTHSDWPTKHRAEIIELKAHGRQWILRLSDVEAIEAARYFSGHCLSMPADSYAKHDWAGWSTEQQLLFAGGAFIEGTDAVFSDIYVHDDQCFWRCRLDEDVQTVAFDPRHFTRIDLHNRRIALTDEMRTFIADG